MKDNLVLRGVEPEIIEALDAAAARNGLTIELEHLRILRDALGIAARPLPSGKPQNDCQYFYEEWRPVLGPHGERRHHWLDEQSLFVRKERQRAAKLRRMTYIAFAFWLIAMVAAGIGVFLP